MTVEADISHPGIGRKDQLSIAAIYASRAITNYDRVSVNNQIMNISDLLKAFYEKNRVLLRFFIEMV